MSGTVLAVIAQGGKRLALGERLYEYGAGQYLVASVDLPVTGQVMDTGRPTLGFGKPHPDGGPHLSDPSGLTQRGAERWTDPR
jgi:hypothetical protein